MIHIVTAANRHLYQPQLAAMHRLRTVHFVQERGWSLKVREDGGEYDQYDDERTIYGLAVGASGQVLGGVRLRPTDDKCMLTDDLPQLVATSPESIVGPDVWELTRLFTTREARDRRKLGGPDVKIELLVAALEFANAQGAFRVLCSFTMRDYAAFNAGGYNIRLTGLPCETADAGLIAGMEMSNADDDIAGFKRRVGRVRKTWLMANDVDVALAGSVEALQRHSEQPGRGASREAGGPEGRGLQ
ncbi:MAG: acyl-homoserine-lactone synthase [Caulobacteraceae bacterium]